MTILVTHDFLARILEYLEVKEGVLSPSSLLSSTTSLFSEPVSQGLKKLFPHLELLSVLKGSNVEQIFCWTPSPVKASIPSLNFELSSLCGSPVSISLFSPKTLEEIFGMFEQIGLLVGNRMKGKELSNRIRAQSMDWGDNFYERTKNKRVIFLSSVDPLLAAGQWIPDFIRTASAISYLAPGEEADKSLSWEQILEFRPDVLLIAPRGYTLGESVRCLPLLERSPLWEKIPAVKRGEVIFADGKEHFYSPGVDLIESLGICISAIAAIESGYIIPRDIFFRLRWIELNRHKLAAIQ